MRNTKYPHRGCTCRLPDEHRFWLRMAGRLPELGFQPEIEDYPRRYVAMFEAVENSVDRRQGLSLDIGLDLALDCECEGFGHVLAAADERSADGYAVRHHVEEGNRKFTRRQPDQNAGAELAGHANTLPECAE